MPLDFGSKDKFRNSSGSPNHVFAVGRRGLNGINSETKYRLQKYLSKRPWFSSCKGIQENKFYKIEQQRMIGVKLGLIGISISGCQVG